MTEPFQFRNADGTLRLDEALGERYVKHYQTMLDSSPREFAAMQLSIGVEAPPDSDAYSWQEPPPGIGVVFGYVLQPHGFGPDACSSSTALVPAPEIIWDVCGYYRRLGFHWTEFAHVTPKMIRYRYLTLDPRQEDSRLFYAASQLLDKVIRAAYDRMPLGGLFIGDRDVQEMLRANAAREAARRNAALHEAGLLEDEDDPTDHAKVLREWGIESGVSDADARQRLRGEESQPLRGEALGSTLSGWDRKWTYYRLVPPDEPSWALPAVDVAALAEWQALLCAVLSDHGVTVRFSVGIWPGLAPVVWRDSNRSCIFFATGKPTRDMAEEAVAGYLAQTGKTG